VSAMASEDGQRAAQAMTQPEKFDIDRCTLAWLRLLRVASAGTIAHHIGPPHPSCSSQAVAHSLQRLRKQGLVRRAGRSRTCWEPTE
jgi:hypothetical protein